MSRILAKPVSTTSRLAKHGAAVTRLVNRSARSGGIHQLDEPRQHDVTLGKRRHFGEPKKEQAALRF
jgi:hypothetical protein